MDKTKQLGQYFTPDFVANFMVGLISKTKEAYILEPSSGEGVFLSALKKAGYKNFIGYEIDESLIKPDSTNVRNESFISASFERQFDAVVGNPPYVRWKNMADTQKSELSNDRLWNQYFNSLSDYLYIFILKSVELLREGGELIFITPEYWHNTMHSQSLRNYLLDHGYIQEIYHFNETPIFSKVASSIIIIKYIKTSEKSRLNKSIKIHRYSSKRRLSGQDLVSIDLNDSWSNFNIEQFAKNESWILAPDNIKDELLAYEDKCRTRSKDFHPLTLIPEEMPYVKLGDISNIANGLVSGLDKAFQLPSDIELSDKENKSTLNVVKAKDVRSFISTDFRRYIFLNKTEITESELQKDYPVFYEQLVPYKDDLLKRYSYNRQINYWDWVFLRSMKVFNQDKEKLFVPCKERITNKTRLRFCIASPEEYPTQDITAIYLNENVKETIYYILALLNNKVTYDWVKYKGLMKGGIAEFSERPLASIPIRLIDWANKNDVSLHNKITKATKAYISGNVGIEKIDKLVLELLS